MESLELWEKLALGAVAIGAIFLFRPGIKAALQQSREAEKDWKGVLVPLALVVLFVILLISIV
jgi:hypothetical protein